MIYNIYYYIFLGVVTNKYIFVADASNPADKQEEWYRGPVPQEQATSGHYAQFTSTWLQYSRLWSSCFVRHSSVFQTIDNSKKGSRKRNSSHADRDKTDIGSLGHWRELLQWKAKGNCAQSLAICFIFKTWFITRTYASLWLFHYYYCDFLVSKQFGCFVVDWTTWLSSFKLCDLIWLVSFAIYTCILPYICIVLVIFFCSLGFKIVASICDSLFQGSCFFILITCTIA